MGGKQARYISGGKLGICKKMCKVYNQIGSLTTIKSHLRNNNVYGFKSLNELINFQKNYSLTRQQIIVEHRLLIEEEKRTLHYEIIQLDQGIIAKKNTVEEELILELEELKNQLANLPTKHPTIIQQLLSYAEKFRLKLKIKNHQSTFDFKIVNSLKHLTDAYNRKSDRNLFIVSSFEDAVMESSWPQLQELDRKKEIIDQVNNSIYGAIGEHKVVKELGKLAEDCILINDFTCKFYPPIYNQQENDYIKSVQIDHILLSPSGIFLIETKNWSQHSLKNHSFYSPVQQIKRANFALYNIINSEKAHAKLPLSKHHWGKRKIPIKNLIVLINHKPVEEFQYVKILTLNDLLSYINYFKPCYSANEMKMIADYLLRLRAI